MFWNRRCQRMKLTSVYFSKKAGYIRKTYNILKAFVNGTVIQWNYSRRALIYNMVIYLSNTKIFLWLSHYHAHKMVYLPAPSILYSYIVDLNFAPLQLLTYSNYHRKNSSYNYIIYIRLIYFYIIYFFQWK